MEEKEKKKSNKTSKTNKEKQVKKSVNKSKNNEKINKEKSKEQVKNNKKKEVSLVEEQKVKKILVKEEDKKKLEEKNEVVKTKNIFKRLLNKLNPEENKFNFLEIILLMFMAFVVGVFASQAISLKIPILNNTTVIEDTSEITREYNLIINK